MCQKCEGRLVIDKWKYFVGAVVTVIILVVSQIFVYGQFTANVQSHLEDKIIHQMPENMDRYMTNDEFEPYKNQLDRIETKLDLLNEFLLRHDRRNP